MEMWKLHGVRNTIHRIATSTSVEVRWGDIVATARRLQSPYLSHQNIEFTDSRESVIPPVVYVSDGLGHALVLRACKWDIDHGVLQALPDRPIGRLGLVAVWEEARLPAFHLAKVTAKIAALGGPPIEPQPLATVYFRARKYIGNYNSHPLFKLAGENNAPLDLAGQVEIVAQDGEAVVYRLNAEAECGRLPHGPRIGNRLVVTGPNEGYTEEPYEEEARPLFMAEFAGIPAAVQAVTGPGVVWQRRYGEVSVLARLDDSQYVVALNRP